MDGAADFISAWGGKGLNDIFAWLLQALVFGVPSAAMTLMLWVTSSWFWKVTVSPTLTVAVGWLNFCPT